ncbi:hypothetical protein KIH31_02620 [Paenarthrobacter sp. DKR-5]|uniref:hypothetical protein n=1 Tax=Paenarthrobacter sp. DKR-5 TaxID=2835535 RepID=UPI001BDDAEAE|nr:hypothetical protein [Paenarthrobacter sp. DKR-5]MBT1001485.1 hypothetical protein [Paenarthrobacter sp. DKR-5]
MSTDQLSDAARELYALPPDEFVAARNERSKRAAREGDKESGAKIKALAKPSAAAWALNMLARQEPGLVGSVVALGAELRAAQEHPDRKKLTELGRRRHEVLKQTVDRAGELSKELGHPLSAAAVSDVERSLWAVLASAGAAAAVSAGSLVKTLSPTELEPPDVQAAVAVPGVLEFSALQTEPSAAPVESKSRRSSAEAARRAKAERRAEDSERRAHDADAELAAADHHLEDLERRRDGMTAELEELEAKIEAAERDLLDIDRRVRALRRDRERAALTADDARAAADRDRDELDRLS